MAPVRAPESVDPNGNKYEYSHPLQNTCIRPILRSDEPNINPFITHPRSLTCAKTQPEWITFYPETGQLHSHPDIQTLKSPAACFWHQIGGSLRPRIYEVDLVGSWEKLPINSAVHINVTQFVVYCYDKLPDDRRDQMPHEDSVVVLTFDEAANKSLPMNFWRTPTYKKAFAQIAPLNEDRKLVSADGIELSLDMIVLDSTSLNQFQRHAPKSWRYMRDVMNFDWLEGYNKVGDNSAVNLLPILTGLRYANQSDGLNSDVNIITYETQPMDIEATTFLWHKMQDAVSLWNDDPMHYGRGLLHYPIEALAGFTTPPTDYYYRAWHAFNYKYSINTTGNAHCIHTTPYYEASLTLVEQFIRRYYEKYHFSFSFLTELTHDDPANLEVMDDYLEGLLKRLHTEGLLKHSALIIMGDHGNRVHQIKHSYVGRVEERLPLMAVRFPEWFREQNADLLKKFQQNRHRLTTNFDVHQTLVQMVTGKGAMPDKLSSLNHAVTHGQSLFAEVDAARDCQQAEIPPQYCTCLESHRLCASSKSESSLITIREAIYAAVTINAPCANIKLTDIKMDVSSMRCLTVSQLVRHGIRQFDEYYKRMKNVQAAMELEDLDVRASIKLSTYKFGANLTNNSSTIQIRTLVRHDQMRKSMDVLVDPIIVDGFVDETCSRPVTLVRHLCEKCDTGIPVVN